MLAKLKSFINQSIRVFKITKKPTMLEFKTIVKVTAIGILIIGFIGFAINMIWAIVS